MAKFLVPSYKKDEKVILRIDNYAVGAFKKAKYRVKKKNWDYICCVVGLPGAGKSKFAQGHAKYCDPNFNVDRIAFDADEFIEITNACPEYGAVVLDESFSSLNSRTTMTPEFLKIVNHLQLIRQRHLFIFLCLPNFFDLAKGIAIFRTSHLFVVYADENGNRGSFLAFGRREKTKLYVKGSKYMDYNCIKANFFGKFWLNNGIIDDKEYERRKAEHLQNQNKEENDKLTGKSGRNEILYKLHRDFQWKTKDLCALCGLKGTQMHDILKKEAQKDKNTPKNDPRS